MKAAFLDIKKRHNLHVHQLECYGWTTSRPTISPIVIFVICLNRHNTNSPSVPMIQPCLGLEKSRRTKVRAQKGGTSFFASVA